MAAQVEAKVQASTAVAAVSGLALWALGRYVFKTGVPDVVASWIYVIVPGVLTFAAGYLAKHTPRPGEPAGNMPADTPAGRGTYVQPEVGLPPGYVPPPAALTPPPEKTLQPPAVPE
ncbi:MAG TPA: hypothetical protein VGL33_30420 [Streptosporangiaceae bacterium]|jgi:hypothetical protein